MHKKKKEKNRNTIGTYKDVLLQVEDIAKTALEITFWQELWEREKRREGRGRERERLINHKNSASVSKERGIGESTRREGGRKKRN